MPSVIEEIREECYEYLDTLRDSGVTNMFGAAPYLQNAFPELSKHDARDMLMGWMKSFGERHVN